MVLYTINEIKCDLNEFNTLYMYIKRIIMQIKLWFYTLSKIALLWQNVLRLLNFRIYVIIYHYIIVKGQMSLLIYLFIYAFCLNFV